MHVIGGKFGLPDMAVPCGLAEPLISGPRLDMANARSCLFAAMGILKPQRVWVPSYLCETMLYGTSILGLDVAFYPVSRSLLIEDRGWVADVRPGEAVVFIDYFGWPYDRALSSEVCARGATVVEDAAQALMIGEVDPSADFVVFSPRKFLGTTDGGILWARDGRHLMDIDLEPPPCDWLAVSLAATIKRRDFDMGAEDRSWVELFKRAEELQPVGYFRKSDIASVLIEQFFDYREIATVRQRNYDFLAGHLASIALYPCRGDSVVPLGFTIKLEQRDHLRARLIEQSIYPPVYWEIEGVVPPSFSESHRLSKSILTLPCDQRYSEKDMEKIVICVKQVLNI